MTEYDIINRIISISCLLKGDKTLSYTELLENAKKGGRTDYDVLCGTVADDIYRIACLTLMNNEDALNAVKSAFSDGFGSISRINDLPHLKAWLLRELTRNMVAKLKEYRALGQTAPVDAEMPSAITSLSDIDRLVYSIFSVCNYSVKEISIITSLTEENVTKKLNSANEKIRNEIISVKSFISSVTAPEVLKPKEEKKPKLMRFVPSGGEYTEEEETESDTTSEKPDSENTDTYEDPTPSEAPIFAPEEEEEAEEKEEEPEKRILNAETFIDIIASEKIKGSEFLALIGNTRISNSAYHEIEQNPSLTRSRLIELLDNSPLTEADYAKMLTSIKERRDKLKEKAEPKAVKPQSSLYDETTGLFSGHRERPRRKKHEEKKKSDLALALENKGQAEEIPTVPTAAQKPYETGGTLTFAPVEAEYSVKTLKNEEKKAEKEEAPSVTEEKKPEPAETNIAESVINPILNSEPEIETEKVEEKPAEKAPEAEAKPVKKEEADGGFRISMPAPSKTASDNSNMSFTSDIDLDEADGIYGLDEEIDELEEFDELDNMTFTDGVDPFSAIKEETAAPVNKDAEKNETEKTEETPAKKRRMSDDFREKYKGNDFFIDDDEYYEGVNRGKLVFCAVCAVLLIGVSFLIRYLTTGSLLPVEKMPETEQAVPVISVPEEITSLEDISVLLSNAEERYSVFDTEYYRGDDTPYTEALFTSPSEKNDLLLIPGKDTFKAVLLDETAPKIVGETGYAEGKSFLGFLTDDKNIYLVYEDSEGIYTEIYDDTLALGGTYSQSGKLSAINADSERLLLITKEEAKKRTEVTENDLPFYTVGGEKKTVAFEDFEAVSGISYGGITTVGIVSGGEAEVSAVIGGYDSFASFDEKGYSLIIADCNRTAVRNYSLIGTRSELISETVYEGEAFGADSLNGNVLTGYNPYKNSITINKIDENKNETLVAVENALPVGIAYNGEKTYIIAKGDEGAKLYGFNGFTPIENITPEAVYTEKLKGCGKLLTGLKAEADENGNRTGLRLSLYSYDNGLEEEAYALIGVDAKTDSQYLKYLSGDGEESPLYIACDESGSKLAVGTVYFDGISEIERILIYGNIDGSLTELGNIMLFDINSDYRALAFRNNTLFIITEDTIITADAETCSPKGYFTGDESENASESVSEEATEESEASEETEEDEITLE